MEYRTNLWRAQNAISNIGQNEAMLLFYHVTTYEVRNEAIADSLRTDTCSHIASTARPSSAMIADGLRYMRTRLKGGISSARTRMCSTNETYHRCESGCMSCSSEAHHQLLERGGRALLKDTLALTDISAGWIWLAENSINQNTLWKSVKMNSTSCSSKKSKIPPSQ